jgi:hypothetical protein
MGSFEHREESEAVELLEAFELFGKGWYFGHRFDQLLRAATKVSLF